VKKDEKKFSPCLTLSVVSIKKQRLTCGGGTFLPRKRSQTVRINSNQIVIGGNDG
jgi:hypothetical protein